MNEELTPPLTEVENRGWDQRLRIFRAQGEVDTFVLLTQRYLIVIDTMSTPEHMAAIMERVKASQGDRQLLVMNTHADFDHCWGNALFATPNGSYPAPILAHEKARHRMNSQQERDYLRDQMQAEPRFRNVQLIPPTITCSDELHIDGGDLTLALLPAPGHQPDQLCVWIPELRLLLAADAAEHPIPYTNDPLTLELMRTTLCRLRDLKPDLVIPCHGNTTDPKLLTRNIEYFDTVERRTREALETGQVNASLTESKDLPDLVGFPFAEMLSVTRAEAYGNNDFYGDCHIKAHRAMLINLTQ